MNIQASTLESDTAYVMDMTDEVKQQLYKTRPEFAFSDQAVPIVNENVFMRKDSNQIVMYARMFLDTLSWRLTPAQAVVVALMDGERTIDDISTLLQQYAGGTKELNDFKVRRVLAWVAASEHPRPIIDRRTVPAIPVRKFDPKDFLIPEDQVELSPILDKPIGMLWMPTSVCQTDCIYCYATRRPIPKADLLSDARVKELFDEAADIGICKANLDGGDALCRENIDELIAYATERNIECDISTKCYVSEDFAKRLRDAGVRIMQFGFDAPFPDLFDEVVGRKGHFHRTMESIQNCTRAGIVVRTNSILTQETYRHIHELVDLLHTLPLHDMKIATAFRSLHRPKPELLLREDQKQWLRAQIARLREKYPSGKINFECSTDYRAMTAEQRESELANFPRCGIGQETIIITPDGRVSMCEQSPQTEEFIVGSVKENAIMDVWQCDKMKAVSYTHLRAHET